MGGSRVEQRAPAITEFLLQLRRRQAVPVGHVLPVSGQGLTEGQQRRLLQLPYAHQHLAFGVGVFQGQVEVMQQAAEQGAIQQPEGLPRVGLPEDFGTRGNVGRQGLVIDVQPE